MDRIRWLIVAGIALAGAASASVTACTGQTIATLQSAADNGNTPGNGCGSVDLGFNAFVVATSGIVSGQNLLGPSAGSIAITDSGDSYTFSSAGWTTGASSKSAETLGSEVSLLAAPTNATSIDGLTALSVSGFSGKGSVTITETFCLGVTSAAGCTSSNEGTIDVQEQIGTVLGASCGTISSSYGCVANNSAGTVSFNGVSNVFLQDTVQISHPSNYASYSSSFSSFTAGFDELNPLETTEPPTYALLGSALVGIGLIRRKPRE